MVVVGGWLVRFPSCFTFNSSSNLFDVEFSACLVVMNSLRVVVDFVVVEVVNVFVVDVVDVFVVDVVVFISNDEVVSFIGCVVKVVTMKLEVILVLELLISS